jgi:hypothetical protein
MLSDSLQHPILADDSTKSKNSSTLTDFSVPENLGIRELREKSLGEVGLPELTRVRRLFIYVCKISMSFCKPSAIVTTLFEPQLYNL